MSSKAMVIKERYKKNYVTNEQLVRYYELGAITKEEYEEIKNSK